ncbi:MAG: hypothetical protein C4558_00385 [Dehalococcoidia bacterium]|nr:MAG: hypothetical protein C4558_00385 [Dehalococcoidia bacterium]
MTPGDTPRGTRGASMSFYDVSVQEGERDRAQAVVSGVRVRGVRPVARGTILVLIGAGLLFARRSG